MAYTGVGGGWGGATTPRLAAPRKGTAAGPVRPPGPPWVRASLKAFLCAGREPTAKVIGHAGELLREPQGPAGGVAGVAALVPCQRCYGSKSWARHPRRPAKVGALPAILALPQAPCKPVAPRASGARAQGVPRQAITVLLAKNDQRQPRCCLPASPAQPTALRPAACRRVLGAGQAGPAGLACG